MRTLVLLIAGFVAWVSAPAAALAGSLFSDGYLGLTQEELRAKLGQPQKIRDRSAALPVESVYHHAPERNVQGGAPPGQGTEQGGLRLVALVPSLHCRAVSSPHHLERECEPCRDRGRQSPAHQRPSQADARSDDQPLLIKGRLAPASRRTDQEEDPPPALRAITQPISSANRTSRRSARSR